MRSLSPPVARIRSESSPGNSPRGVVPTDAEKMLVCFHGRVLTLNSELNDTRSPSSSVTRAVLLERLSELQTLYDCLMPTLFDLQRAQRSADSATSKERLMNATNVCRSDLAALKSWIKLAAEL